MNGSDSLRIAVLAPVWFQVPPRGYGGIEWIVSLLADGLAEKGHDVTLFASGDSHTQASHSYVYEHAPSHLIGQSLTELHHALACYERADEFDVVNDHSGLLAASLAGGTDVPILHTVHGPLDAEGGTVYEQIARFAPPPRDDLAVAEPAATEAGPALGGEHPERARPFPLPVQAAPRRLHAVPRPHEPGQGRASRDRGRDGDGSAAEARREEARRPRNGTTSRSSSSRT